MEYDWRALLPPDIHPAPGCDTFLEERVSEMSPKEWRIFRAALEINPQQELAGVAALTFHLHAFDFYYPAYDDTALGEQLARYNYGARSDVLPFLDHARIGAMYRQEHRGVHIDDAFVVQCGPNMLDRLRLMAESIEAYGIPPAAAPSGLSLGTLEGPRDASGSGCSASPSQPSAIAPADDDWSAKVHIDGPCGDAWLRLPSHEEVNGGQADEVRVALDDLGADSLADCALLEARCIFPDIDLMDQYNDLEKLVFDASNLGFALAEAGQGQPHFREKLNAALEYEGCTRLDFALDIVSNMDCYDFVPRSELRRTAGELLPAVHHKQPLILESLDYEAYAAEHFRAQGMREVKGGFFMRNDTQFMHMYSRQDEQAAIEQEMG